MQLAVYAMVFGGAALMVYNIVGFVRFARNVEARKTWGSQKWILYFPIVLLILFFLGYLAVGFFGKPDLIIGGILFGGSIFVFCMYKFLYGIIQQIMDSEKMEAELLAVEESNRLKTSFLASISHEMRTPMNVIIGMNTLELKNPSISRETREHLEKIGSSANQLLSLINNILNMNRIETGSITIRKEEFSLFQILEQISSMAQVLCEKKGLDYSASFAEEGNRQFLGDESAISQVLLSILDNAVKYTDPPGRVTFKAGCSSVDGDAYMVRFIIADTGIGIDIGFLPKLFDAFTKEDASFNDIHGGSGLSMGVTKNLVELMGGTIGVESEKNVGTTFTVKIPLVCAAAHPVSADAEEKADAEEVSLAGRRVLIVEDIPENAEIVADLLELEDIETEHAENGKIAVDMFDESPLYYYDAILMDLRMPVMDGLEATRKIRALEREDAARVPIIALTANAFESDVEASLQAGMNMHLPKPSDAEKLYGTLKALIRKKPEEG